MLDGGEVWMAVHVIGAIVWVAIRVIGAIAYAYIYIYIYIRYKTVILLEYYTIIALVWGQYNCYIINYHQKINN